MANGDLDAVVRAMPQFKALGPLFKSSAPVKLTEEETEYSISAVKHVYARHLLLQFNCTNTVEEQVLEDVAVTVDLAQAVRILLQRLGPRTHGCPVPTCTWLGMLNVLKPTALQQGPASSARFLLRASWAWPT